jgi:hypothetical protein
MTQQEIQERNKQIALMLGAEIQNVLERIYIDKMIDDELTFHNTSVTLDSYEWNGTTNIHYIPFDMLEFHSDWNWLHEAVTFCKSKIGTPSSVKIACLNGDINKALMTAEKEAVFTAVSDFAKLYNEKKL